MTAAVATGRGARKSARGWFWIGLVVLLMIGAAITGGPSGDQTAGPTGTGPTGTRALVLLMEAFGADVEVGTVIGADTDVVYLDHDLLDATQRRELNAFLAGGGRLIVADPFSSFASPIASGVDQNAFIVTEEIDREVCDLDALDGVEQVNPAGGFRFVAGAGDAQCFGPAGEGLVVSRADRGGVVVSLGSPRLFDNATLGDLDNAALAVDLLAPEPGTAVVHLGVGENAEPDNTLFSLLSSNVRLALAQLLVALVIWVLYRARRLGPPIVEHQPVRIAGSELVAAVGELLQQTGDPQHAADVLAADLRRSLADRIGLPPTAEPEVVAEMVAARAGLDAARVKRAIQPEGVTTDERLVEVAQEIASIRQEVFHGQHASPTR